MLGFIAFNPTYICSPGGRGKTAQRGIALVVVLWLLALLTVMAAGYSATMRTESRLTVQQLQTSQARALAEAGVWLTVNDLMKPDLERAWSADGTLYDLSLFDGRVELSIQDQFGKIDLNTARPELLQALFTSVAVEEATAAAIVDAILDWRDRDDLVRLHGAEDSDYRRAGYDHEAKDGPFNSIDELRLVMGMTNEIYQKVYPALTIHSHMPGINPEVAPAPVLLVIPGLDPEAIDRYLAARADPAVAADASMLTGTNSIFTNRTKGVSFMITSTGIVNDARAALEVIISLRRTSALPYTVLAWREI